MTKNDSTVMQPLNIESGVAFDEQQERDWYLLFRQYDRSNSGSIPLPELRSRLQNAASRSGMSQKAIERLLNDVDRNRDKQIDFEEFCLLMSRAKNLQRYNLMFQAARMVTPKTQRREKFRYLAQYTCCPPPLFILLVSIVEVALYIYYVVSMDSSVRIDGPTPLHSPLIYDPYRRYQAWRYLTYIFVHIGIYHILFNTLTQLLIGLPLELVHKWWRVGLVYLIGSAGGSLAVSVCDPKTYLAGASGGVYSILAAHVANLVVNWTEMEYAWIRLVFLTILIGSDFGVALYNRYAVDSQDPVSYVAHLGGFVTGLLLGIVVLRNFKQKAWERIVWWIALVGLCLLFLFCVFWNIFYKSQYNATVWEPFTRAYYPYNN